MGNRIGSGESYKPGARGLILDSRLNCDGASHEGGNRGLSTRRGVGRGAGEGGEDATGCIYTVFFPAPHKLVYKAQLLLH